MGIAVDGNGTSYVTGYTMSSEASFPVSGGPDMFFNGFYDAFVVRMDFVPNLPSMDVQGNGVSIAYGDSTPSLVDHTDFGSVRMLDSGGVLTRVFTIINPTQTVLVLADTPVTVTSPNPAEFSVLVQPANPVAPDGSTTFTIQFAPAGTGTRAALVRIASGNPGEDSFIFTIQGDSNHLLYMPNGGK